MTERIDLTKSEQYTLSIRLSADGFSFSIYNPAAEGEFHFEHYPVNASYSMTANLKEMLAATDALKHPFKRINVLYDTHRFTPIPFDLFEDEQMDTLFYHNFTKADNETVLCNVLGKSNIVILFGIDKHAHQLLADHFPTARIFSTVSPLTEYFARKSRTGHARKLYAHVREEALEVYAYDKGKLQLINTFPCSETADRVYYLLYIWQQLGFDQERDELHLTGGNNGAKKMLVAELRNYLRQVFLIHPSAEFNRAEVSRMEEIPFDMQTLILCE